VVADYVVVGVIGPAHGIKGEVYVEPRTDEPARRFAPGATLTGVRRVETREFEVEARKEHQGKNLIRFVGINNRNEAEEIRGFELRCAPDTERPDDPDEFYDHQLIGLEAHTDTGRPIGTVKQVQHHAQDLLVIATETGEVLVPFVTALVPVVDLDAGRLIVVDKPGLLDTEEN
jgi:16S rRNA processing protein RimM